MHPFLETLSIAGGIAAALVAAIALLTLFFKALSWLAGGAKPDTVAVRGVLKKDTLATVYVSGTKPFEQVRFLGFLNSQSIKAHLPWELNGMVLLEDEHQVRFLVRAKDIRMIVISPERTGLPAPGIDS